MPAPFVDEQALKDRKSELAKLREFADEYKRQFLEAYQPGMAAGDPEAKKNYELASQMRASDVAKMMAQQANEFGNTDLVRQFNTLAEESHREDLKAQSDAERDQFEATRGSLSGIITDVGAPIYRGLDAFARTGSFGLSELAKSGARWLTEKAGGTSMEKSEAAEAALLKEGARTGLGSLAGGTAEALGTIAGFGGKGMVPRGKAFGVGPGARAPFAVERLAYSGPVGAMERIADAGIAKGGLKELGARVVGSNVGQFVGAGAAGNLGTALTAKVNDWLYGESPNRPRAGEILSQLPIESLNMAIMGATLPVFQRIGRGISSSLVGKWAPALEVGKAIEGLSFKTRMAQGAGGVAEFFGLTTLPHISENKDGHLAITHSWHEAFNGNIAPLLEQVITGFILGAKKGHYEGGPQELGPAKGMLLRRKPALPFDVARAIKKSAQEASEEILKHADGEERFLGSMLNAVRAREQLGYEPPGTFDAIATLAEQGFAKEQTEKAAKKAEFEDVKARKESDRTPPKEQGFLEPGMGITTPEDAATLGRLPFMVDESGRTFTPSRPGSWPADVRPDLADPGTMVEINLGGPGKKANWVVGRVTKPVMFESPGKQQQLRGVEVQTEHGLARFDGNHIRKGLVRMPADEAGAREPLTDPRLIESPPREEPTKKPVFGTPRVEDVPGQRKLLGLNKPPPKPTTVEDAAKAGAKAAEQAKVPGEKPAETPPKKKKAPLLGAGPGERGTDRRKALVPVAVDRRASKQTTRRVIAEADKDNTGLTPFKNKGAFTRDQKAIVGNGLKIARIDGSNIKAANEHPTEKHAHGDKVITAMALRIKAAAQEAGLRETSLYRVGGDEFAVIGTGAEIRKFRKALLGDKGKVGETVLGGKKYEHRVIPGEAKDTDVEADASQNRFHERYKKQAEAAGLGVFRKAIEAKPAETPAKKPVFATGGAKAERKAKSDAQRVEAARERLKGSGLPPEKIQTTGDLYHVLSADAGKVYVPGKGWKPVKWADVVAARESKNPDRIAFVERAAQIRDVTEPAEAAPKATAPTTAEAESPSSKPAVPPEPSSTEPPAEAAPKKREPLIVQMGVTEEYLHAIKSAGIPVEQLDAEMDHMRHELGKAEAAGDAKAEEAWTKALDFVARLKAKREAPAGQEEPKPTRVATEPGLTTPSQIAERSVARAKNELAVMRAAYEGEATRTGKPVTAMNEARMRAQEKNIKDLEKLAKVVAKKGRKVPFEVTSTTMPEYGDNVVIRLDNGRAVEGVVLESSKIKKADVESGEEMGYGRRVRVLKPDGSIERVRLSDVVDIAPADVMTHDFSKGTEVSLGTFSSWFGGRQSADTPGYEGSERLSSDFSEDPRSKGVLRRQALVRGGGTLKDAEREAVSRARRAKYGALNSADYEIEANAFLAPRTARNSKAVRLVVDRKGDMLGRYTEKSKPAREEVAWDEEVRPNVHYYDPDVKLRDPSELEALANSTGPGSKEADEDWGNYLFFKQKADQALKAEIAKEAQDSMTRRLGRGFAVVNGDLEDLPNGATVILRQQSIVERKRPEPKEGEERKPGDIPKAAVLDYGTPKLLAATMTPEGKVIVREMSVADVIRAYGSNPGLRATLQEFARSRHESAQQRLSEEEKAAVMSHVGQIGLQVQEAIGNYFYGDGDLPGKGAIFDQAREWLRKNPRPKHGTQEFKAWETAALEQLNTKTGITKTRGSMPERGEMKPTGVNADTGKETDVSKGAIDTVEEPTIFDAIYDSARLMRDPITEEPMTVKDGKVVPVSVEDSGILIPSILPGAPPPGTIAAGKKVVKWMRKGINATGRFSYDVTRAVYDSVVREVQNVLFRPDQLGVAEMPFGQSNFFRKWAKAARTFEAHVMPSGDEHLGRVLNYLNRHDGEESTYIERIEKALKPLTKLPIDRQLEIVRDYTEGKKPKELAEYGKFMDEMLDELIAAGLLPKEGASRFRGTYVPYGKFALTDAQFAAKKAQLKLDLDRALRSGNTKAVEEAQRGLENLSILKTKATGTVGPTRVIISPVPIERIGDPETSALLKSGMLRRRGFKDFDEAVKHGLDVSNPVELLKSGMWTEMMAVTRHRLFQRLVADERLVMDDKGAPDWYVEVDKGRTSKHSSWDKLDGKRVNPFLLDQLYHLDYEAGPVRHLLDYVHGTLKASRALVDPSAIMTNLLGNPLILTANGMSMPTAYAEYMRAFSQLVLVDPALQSIWRKAGLGRVVDAATKMKYGSQREKYMKEGWVTHMSDVTRELQVALNNDRSIRDLVLRGYTDAQNVGQNAGFFRALLNAMEAMGEKSVRFYNLIDASARAALHEWNIEHGGMKYDQSAEEVNKSFDVQHLPKVWRGIRSGLGGIGADSFVSFKVAMARNAGKFLSNSPWMLANAYAVNLVIRSAIKAMYGWDDEEMDDYVDASLPVTGSKAFDRINRMTALVIPSEDGPRVLSMVKYTPHDAMLDLVPGVRPTVLGGTDDKGRKPEDFLWDYFSRSVLSGPYAEWYLDHDAMTGAPVRDRYSGIGEYLMEKTALPLALPGKARGVVPFLSMVQRKANLLRQSPGGDTPRYTANVPLLKTKNGRDSIPGATAGRASLSDAMWQMFGLRGQRPDQIRRALEDARANDPRVVERDGRFSASEQDRGAPDRTPGRRTAKELEMLRDAERGLKVWAAVLDLERATAEGTNPAEVAGIKEAISRMARNNAHIEDARKALIAVGEAGKASDLSLKMRRLGVFPERETRIPRGQGGSILPR